MTRYADPQRCPDCGGHLEQDDLACPSCRLPLRGATAAELFRVLSTADALVARLRAAAAAAGPAAGDPATRVLPPGGLAGRPSDPLLPGDRPRTHRLSAASVPKILLGLGALCLLVAALVFLAVTWSAMGVGGRTATLLGFTVVTAALAAWMCLRDLRGAGEALSLVALGLLTLDVFGARAADWLGDVTTPGFVAVLGAALAATGAGAALAARRTPVGTLTAPEVVAGVGTALLAAGVAGLETGRTAVMLVVATVGAGVLAWAAARVRLRYAAVLAAIATTLAWFAQLAHALESVSTPSVAALWGRGEVVELLVSAALAASLVLVRVLATAGRVAGGALGVAVLAVAVVLPAFDESGTVVTLAGLGVLVAAAAVAWWLPRPWGLVAVVTQGAAALGVLVALAAVTGRAAERLAEVVAAGWEGQPGDLLPGTVTGVPQPWLAPAVVLALLLTGVSLARALAVGEDAVPTAGAVPVGAGLVLAAGVVTLACYPVPVVAVLLALLAAGGGFLGWWLVRPGTAPLALATTFLLASAAVGIYDEWFTVAASTAVLAAAVVVHLRAAPVETATVAGALAPVAVAADVWAWGTLAGAEGTWTGLVGLVLLAAAALTLHLYPVSWWRCASAAATRVGVETGAAAVALPLGLAGVLTGPGEQQATWTAVYLTVAGAAVVALSLLRPDRRRLAWVGSGLLALATWVRLADLGVDEPEPYTLPSALALVVVGLLRLRRDPEADTMGALGPGLTLALVPSLLWVLEEPLTARGLLLGLACLALVLVGLRGRWSAPLLLGAVVGGVLVVRMAAPYVDSSVPRWVLIGAAGAVLIATGVTWERRLQEARHMVGYVKSLR